MLKRIIAITCLMFASIGCEMAPVDDTGDIEALDRSERTGTLGYYMVAADRSCDDMPCQDELYIRAVNQAETRCIGSEPGERCRVDALRFDATDLNPEEIEAFEALFRDGYGVVRGWMDTDIDRRGTIVVLNVLEPWRSAVKTVPTTELFNAWAIDIYCVRAPCPDFAANPLNEPGTILLHEVDLLASGADKLDVRYGYHMLERDHLLIAGDFAYDKRAITGPGARTLTAQTFYMPVR